MTQGLPDDNALEIDGITEVADLRELEAPEPMEKILMICARLKTDEKLLAHLPHVPLPLFPHLQARAMCWQVFEQEDGSAKLLIWRAP